MTIQEWFRDGVQYDSEGTQIWAEERTKDAVYLHHVADIRGWGEMQNLFKLDMNKAAAFQDEVGKFVAEAINEKLAKQKLNIHGVMQAEGSDGVSGAAVGNSAAGQSGRGGCVHNTLKYIGPWYSCETCGTHFNARAEAPPEGALPF